MNSAFTDNHAETKAVRIARTVLRGALAAALVLGAGTASAQQYNDRGYSGDRQYGDRGPDQAQHQSRERFTLPQQDRGQRDADMRAYENERRAQQQQQDQQAYPQRDDPRRPSSRLTQDERRDLRRQINEAGRDLYPRSR